MTNINKFGNLSIRPAEATDYERIKIVLEALDLPTEGIHENINNFIVLFYERQLIGTVGLELYGKGALLRSLAIAQEYQGKGYGKKLCHDVIKKARESNVSEIYLLTESAEDFFTSQGFRKISRENVDKNVKSSLEFQSLCPESAVCMFLKTG